MYSAANSQQSNTYQYPTDKKVRKLFEVPTYKQQVWSVFEWGFHTVNCTEVIKLLRLFIIHETELKLVYVFQK